MKHSTAYRIKDRRAKLKMSQQNLADKIGVNKSTISRWESGEIEKVPTSVVDDLATALMTSPGYLMGWDTPESEQEEIINAYITADEKTKRTVRILLGLE